MKKTLTLLFIFFSCLSYSTSSDSLKFLLTNKKNIEQAILCNELCLKFTSVNSDSAMKYGLKGLNIAIELKNNNIQANILNCIGNVFLQNGEYSKALNYYIEAEKIFEKENDLKGIGLTAMNIGYIYELQNIFDKALIQYNHAISLANESKALEIKAEAIGHLGSLYYTQNQKDKALEYFKEALKTNQEINNIPRIMESLNNVAVIYQEMGMYNEALLNFRTDLEYAKKMNIKTDIVALLHNIGLVYKDQKDPVNAIRYLDSSIYIAKEIRDFDDLREAYSSLSEIYQDLKNYPLALECFKLSAFAKDSLLNQTREKQLIEMSTKYETEKKEAENKLLKIEGEKHKAINIAVSIGFILVVCFAFFIFRSYRQKQKANVLLAAQNNEIKAQKHIIEEKQTEILDSITYAKRLQEAILPPKEFIDQFLPQNFILYKPKDIVAGDFYWMENIGDLIFIAAADSTGHGVPGAMVSVVCSGALNRTVKEFGILETGKILDKTRELVIQTFEKSSSEVKDGMDISLLCIDKKNRKVFWSGANNPLWYIHSQTETDGTFKTDLNEIVANKQPIGKTDHSKPFTTHEIPYIENTSFYLFTDGLADQFGGPKGKKYKYKQFADLLKETYKLSIQQQCEAIDKSFSDWKNELEQVDDVCVIGIRI